jgi:hypothetical protein
MDNAVVVSRLLTWTELEDAYLWSFSKGAFSGHNYVGFSWPGPNGVVFTIPAATLARILFPEERPGFIVHTEEMDTWRDIPL